MFVVVAQFRDCQPEGASAFEAARERLRLPGDVLFIAGVLPLVYLTARSVWRPRPAPVAEPLSLESPLFREVLPNAPAVPAGGPS